MSVSCNESLTMGMPPDFAEAECRFPGYEATGAMRTDDQGNRYLPFEFKAGARMVWRGLLVKTADSQISVFWQG